MKTIPKAAWLHGFLQLCAQTLECPPSCAERMSLLQLFKGNSRRACFQTSDFTIIHRLFLCLCFLLFIIWLRDCPSIHHEHNFFCGRLGALQFDNHHHHGQFTVLHVHRYTSTWGERERERERERESKYTHTYIHHHTTHCTQTHTYNCEVYFFQALENVQVHMFTPVCLCCIPTCQQCMHSWVQINY